MSYLKCVLPEVLVADVVEVMVLLVDVGVEVVVGFVVIAVVVAGVF